MGGPGTARVPGSPVRTYSYTTETLAPVELLAAASARPLAR